MPKNEALLKTKEYKQCLDGAKNVCMLKRIRNM